MKNIEIYNTLNIDKDSSSIVATFTQEDDAVMEFKLFKDGQEIVLKDQTISLGAERKDGAVIEQEDGFLIKENNVLNITLKKNIISVVGVVKIQLYLKDTSGEMASNTFNIRVNKKLLGAENVEATNDIKSRNTLVLELKNNTNKLIDDTKAKADKLLNGLQETGDNLSSTVKAKTDKIIEDTKAEVDNIKKDYEGLKKVVIDENIGVKLQKDVTELQNGLKSNQALAYTGSSISAENTLEGRTEGMKIKGKTMYKKKDGTYTDTWEEGVALESFGEKEGNKISILSHNKNFFNINEFSEKINEKGELEFKADGNSRVANYMQIYTERNLNSKIILNGYDSVGREFTTVNQEKYYIWVGLHGDKKDNKVWGEIILPKNTTCYYSAINEKGDNFVKFKDIQIEVGNSKTRYEEDKEDKKDILIKEPLRGVGDVFDVIYEDNGQVEVLRNITKHIFTDKDNWLEGSLNNEKYIGFYVRWDSIGGKEFTKCVCNKFRIINLNEYNEANISGYLSDIGFNIKIEKSKLSTPNINGLKEWLRNNPIEVYYQLATPVKEVVENCVDIDLDTFQGKTYFNILNSMPGNLDFKIPSNLASIVQSHTKDIKILYDLIDRLLIPNLIENKSDLALLSLK